MLHDSLDLSNVLGQCTSDHCYIIGKHAEKSLNPHLRERDTHDPVIIQRLLKDEAKDIDC